ncbi:MULTISPECIES: hypothetical protein [Veillonella]|uniref:hypothetical protein n=1 Tax=Veillonella TaxID=29465 RepID=UPI001D0892EB|nr:MULTISPECIES: hypothetical protein [Veillonella]MCB6514801.1 hypothetical protein [Veillonella atypica]MCG4862255.1 hypothetical protein [Veillonella atypica]MDU2334478.1 hypothetical protein [Veillonella sp.]MDU2347283.1 hypothetical protein [Veillonella sp.]
MSMAKKIEKKLLDKEEKRANELLDELHMDKKDDSDIAVNVETGNKVYDRLLKKETKRMYEQEEELGIKPNSNKK